MNESGKLITEHIIRQLPADQPRFRMEQLRSYGIPDFVVERIEVESRNQLEDELEIPSSKWSDFQGAEVQRSWKNFLKRAGQDIHLPSEYARSMISLVIQDILSLLLNPRKAIPEQLFGSQTGVDRTELEGAISKIVVNRHLAIANLKYMDRKGLEELSLEQCLHVTAKVDERLIERYDVDQWLQQLTPLFLLFEGPVDVDILKTFFRQRGCLSLLGKLNGMDGQVSRQTLSDLISDTSQEGFGNQIFGNPAEELPNPKPLWTPDEEREDPDPEEEPVFKLYADREDGNGLENDKGDPAAREREPIIQEVSRGTDSQAGDSVTTDFEERSSGFPGIQPVDPETRDFETRGSGFPKVQPVDPEKIGVESVETDKADVEGSAVVRSNSDEVESEQQSLWQRFLSNKSEGSAIAGRSVDGKETTDREAAGSESAGSTIRGSEIGGSTTRKSGGGGEKTLQNWLQNQEEYFIQEIFGGSRESYQEAIEKLADTEDWETAASYIGDEIFYRHRIDMYEDAAVDFTDKLHDYFMQINNG